ncbi:MAG: hypothetical protein AAGM21_02230 [Pseudomonadota bacterium]
MRIGFVLCLVVWPGWGQATPTPEPGAWLQGRVAAQYAWQTRAYDTGFQDAAAKPERSQAMALWSIGCNSADRWSTCHRLHGQTPQPTPLTASRPSRFLGMLAAGLILTSLWAACNVTPSGGELRRKSQLGPPRR